MKFSDSHEWINLENSEKAVIGITNYAQKELGDIVYVELPQVGKVVKASQEIAVLESTKAASDIYTPVSGTIVEVNEKLVDSHELINQSPEKDGWIAKILLSDANEMENLMDRKAYEEMLKSI